MNRRDRDPELYHKGRKCPGGFYQKDYWREPPVRYLGYANEIGEALRGHIGGTWVSYTYMIAAAYILGDTLSKAKRVYDNHQMHPHRPLCKPRHSYNFYQNTTSYYGSGCASLSKRVAVAGADAFTWQMLASVIIPHFVLNRIYWGSNSILNIAKVPRTPRCYISTIIGLCSIPMIVRPIDFLAEEVMNMSFRRVYENPNPPYGYEYCNTYGRSRRPY